jgi:hypothetical protein
MSTKEISSSSLKDGGGGGGGTTSSRKKKKKKGALNKLVRYVLLKSGIVEKSKEEQEEEIKREAIARQQIHEIFEINQQWKFVFGEEIPKKKKEILIINDVTPRNCWFEVEYIVSY